MVHAMAAAVCRTHMLHMHACCNAPPVASAHSHMHQCIPALTHHSGAARAITQLLGVVIPQMMRSTGCRHLIQHNNDHVAQIESPLLPSHSPCRHHGTAHAFNTASASHISCTSQLSRNACRTTASTTAASPQPTCTQQSRGTTVRPQGLTIVTSQLRNVLNTYSL
jgi:hypothetical protein